MTAQCKTCRHWGLPPSDDRAEYRDWHANKIGFKVCVGVRPRWTLEDQVPQDIRHGEHGDDAAEALYDKATAAVFTKALAYVQDGSEYIAELVTGPTFGCALHEPR